MPSSCPKLLPSTRSARISWRLPMPTAFWWGRGQSTIPRRSSVCSRWASTPSPPTTPPWPCRSATASATAKHAGYDGGGYAPPLPFASVDDGECVGDGFDHDVGPFADELAVHLDRHRPVAVDLDRFLVPDVQHVGFVHVLRSPERRNDNRQGYPRAHAVQRDEVQACVQLGRGAQSHRALAQVRIGAGVLDDREEQAIALLFEVFAPGEPDSRSPPIEAGEEHPQTRPHEERVAAALLRSLVLLDPSDDGRVQPNAAIAREVATPDDAERHMSGWILRVLQEHASCGHGVVRDAQRTGEYVGHATGHDGHGHVRSGQAVRNLVDSPVSTPSSTASAVSSMAWPGRSVGASSSLNAPDRALAMALRRSRVTR